RPGLLGRAGREAAGSQLDRGSGAVVQRRRRTGPGRDPAGGVPLDGVDPQGGDGGGGGEASVAAGAGRLRADPAAGLLLAAGPHLPEGLAAFYLLLTFAPSRGGGDCILYS